MAIVDAGDAERRRHEAERSLDAIDEGFALQPPERLREVARHLRADVHRLVFQQALLMSTQQAASLIGIWTWPYGGAVSVRSSVSPTHEAVGVEVRFGRITDPAEVWPVVAAWRIGENWATCATNSGGARQPPRVSPHASEETLRYRRPVVQIAKMNPIWRWATNS